MKYKIPADCTHVEIEQIGKQLVITFAPEFEKNEIVICSNPMGVSFIGTIGAIESNTIMLSHCLLDEKYYSQKWLVRNLWNVRSASKSEIIEFNTKCRKHGYNIVNGEKLSNSEIEIRQLKHKIAQYEKKYGAC